MVDVDTHALFVDRIVHILPVGSESLDANNQKSIENIVASARANAPYLDKLCQCWPHVITDLQTHSPERIFTDLAAQIKPSSYEGLCKNLRHIKQQIHLLAALCDLAGVWTWEHVTRALSDFTDLAMAALINCVAIEMEFAGNERGAVPGLFVLALGKYGGQELNYSSDIDLIVFYDPDHIKLPNPDKAERILVRFVKKLMRGFDEVTPDGYVFRTDLRLRPDPRANAVAVSTLTAERYYETLGQNWERAAMIKARFCGGDQQAADMFIDTVLTPFIWRRSLDYAAITDIHAIKRQIQGQASLKDLCVSGHDVKLGLGGIREIEFYAQVQQLILGGRNKNLRTSRTVDVLDALSQGGYADADIAAQLKSDYAALRDLEHRIQMYEDRQTHVWPIDTVHKLCLSYLSGQANVEKFELGLTEVFARVHSHYTNLFPGEEDLSAAQGNLVFTGVEIEDSTLHTLESYGFLRGDDVWKTMVNWLGGRIRATRTPRARELLTRLAPRIIEACGATGLADTAFFNFSTFIENLNAGVSMFSLLANKPDTLASLIDLLAIAPRLTQTLAKQPALIDAMVEPNFLTQTIEVSGQQYLGLVRDDTDFETSLDIIRRHVHEDQFNLTASILRSQQIEKSGEIFSTVAQAAIEALLPKAVQEVERLYGRIDGEYAVLALGKLGGQEMTLRSDIDLMLIYEASGVKPQAGEKTIAKGDPNGVYNKLAKRLVTALSSVTSEGGLYEVDMALRPSGRSGPLAVSFRAFQKYYKDQAWTWEYMALSRARVISASSGQFKTTVKNQVSSALLQKDFKGKLAHDVLDMHLRLQNEKPERGLWDIKNIKGGLRDIEFIAQYLMLKHKPYKTNSLHLQRTQDMLAHAAREKWISDEDAKVLCEISSRYHVILQLKSVAVGGVFTTEMLPIGVRKLIANCVGFESFNAFTHEYKLWHETVKELFVKIIT